MDTIQIDETEQFEQDTYSQPLIARTYMTRIKNYIGQFNPLKVKIIMGILVCLVVISAITIDIQVTYNLAKSFYGEKFDSAFVQFLLTAVVNLILWTIIGMMAIILAVIIFCVIVCVECTYKKISV